MKVLEFAKLYNSLNKSEKDKFEQWLNLKTGIRQQRIKSYLNLWVKGVDQNKIFQTLYPEKYSSGDLLACDRLCRKDRTELKKELTLFITYLELEKDIEKTGVNLYLIRALRSRKIDSLMFKTIKKIKDFLNRIKVLHTHQYHSLYEVEQEYQNYLIKYEPSNTSPNLSLLNKIFDEFWVLEKLKLIIFNQNHFQMYKIGVPTLFENEAVDLAREITKEEGVNPLIEGLLRIYDLLRDKSYSVNSIIRHFLSIKDYLEIDEQISLFHCVLNRVSDIANKSGLNSGYKVLFDVYYWGMESNYLVIDNLLSAKHFKNYVYTAIKIGDTSSAESVIEKWKHKLPEKERESAVTLAKASCYFAKKKFSGALSLVLQTSFTNIGDKLQAKKLHIQSLYELAIGSDTQEHEEEILLTVINSALTFSYRKTKQSERRILDRYLAFFRFTIMLIEKTGKEELNKLLLRSKEKSILPGRSWLQEKIEQKI